MKLGEEKLRGREDRDGFLILMLTTDPTTTLLILNYYRYRNPVVSVQDRDRNLDRELFLLLRLDTRSPILVFDLDLISVG